MQTVKNPQNERNQKWARARAHGADGKELAEPDSKSMWHCLLRPSTFPSQSTFFRLFFKTDARQGRNQDAVSFQRGIYVQCPQVLDVTYVCPRVFHVGREFQLATSQPYA